jgi:glutamate-1-semialdehyde 2,1-aminomutase
MFFFFLSYNWHKQNPTFWKQFYEQMPTMQQIYFADGESLIIEGHYEILGHAIKMGHAKDLELRYNSNGVEWRDDLFDLWKEFKSVRFHYSIDSIKEMNDYIRYPSEWRQAKSLGSMKVVASYIHTPYTALRRII